MSKRRKVKTAGVAGPGHRDHRLLQRPHGKDLVA
jgi:hypothetical protein